MNAVVVHHLSGAQRQVKHDNKARGDRSKELRQWRTTRGDSVVWRKVLNACNWIRLETDSENCWYPKFINRGYRVPNETHQQQQWVHAEHDWHERWENVITGCYFERYGRQALSGSAVEVVLSMVVCHEFKCFGWEGPMKWRAALCRRPRCWPERTTQRKPVSWTEGALGVARLGQECCQPRSVLATLPGDAKLLGFSASRCRVLCKAWIKQLWRFSWDGGDHLTVIKIYRNYRTH